MHFEKLMLLCQEIPSVLVVYASQQGNSQAIAEDLHEECSNHDISSSICCISSLGKDPALLLKQACVIFIAATTGDGEPPDTARKFWRILNKSFSSAAAASGQPPPSSRGKLQTQINESLLKGPPTHESLTTKEDFPALANQLLARDPLLDQDTKVTPASTNQPLLVGDTKVTPASTNQPLLVGDTKVTPVPASANQPVLDGATKSAPAPASANQPLLNRDTKVTPVPASVNQLLLDGDNKHAPASAKQLLLVGVTEVTPAPAYTPQPLLVGDTKVTPSLAFTNQPLLVRDTKVTPASANQPLLVGDAKVTHAAASPNEPLLVGDTKVTPVSLKSLEPSAKTHSENKSAILGEGNQINFVIPLALGTALKDENLNKLSYTVLGLGDTNYTNFCNFGKNLDEKLQKLGAERFYSCGWADDGTGLELVIEPWLEGLWDALSSRLSLFASRQLLRGADKQKGCGNDTTDYRGLMEDSHNCTPDQGKEKEVKNNAEVCRIEKMNGDTRILISKKGEGDITALEDGRCGVNASSQSKKSAAESNLLSMGLDCGGCSLELQLSTEDSGSAGSVQNESNYTLSKKEEDVSADEVCRQVDKLSVKDTLITESFSLGIDNAWKENHVLLQCELPSDLKLTIPKIPDYKNIILDYDTDELCVKNDDLYQNDAPLPSASSAVYNCDVVVFRKLSEGAAGKEVKKVVEVVVQLPSDCSLDYEPGNSLALLVRNDAEEVSLVMDLLGVPDPDQSFTLSRAPSAKRAVPTHFPTRCTARELFTSCIEYKCLPKKAMLLLLLDCATDAHERRCLQELVCREGADLYKKKVLDNRLTFFDVLTVFSSCRPKLSSLLEVLPRLIPRPYSLTSSPLNPQRKISFAYSLTVIPATPHVFHERHGVCTGLLDRLSEQMCNAQNAEGEVHASPRARISFYMRNGNSFRLPEDPAVPIILVGPGCGVAPFVGFLRHRQLQTMSKQLTVEQFGTSWLFFGCRYSRADELYKDELEEFHRSRILTHIRKCFSRESVADAALYVQDAVRVEGKALSAAIMEREARVYVCGDAANMAKDVLATFGEVMAERLGSSEQGVKYVAQMQKDGRYLQDVWT